MLNKTLFRKELKSNYIMLLIFLGVLSMYSYMITLMFDPKLGDSLNTMAESMPELFAAFGMADAGTTLLEFVTNYLYGMLFIAFPGVSFCPTGLWLATWITVPWHTFSPYQRKEVPLLPLRRCSWEAFCLSWLYTLLH